MTSALEVVKNFNYSGTIFGVACVRHEFASRQSMSIFYHSEDRRARLANGPADERLPMGQSVAIIAGLSVLSWAALASVVWALIAAL